MNLISRGSFALAVLCLVGCGSRTDLPLVEVSGQVTFDGGPPPGAGTVEFMPIHEDATLPRRPGVAVFEAGDGAFHVSSFEDVAGLLPGRYRVIVECWKRKPEPSDAGESYVPKDAKFAELEVTGEESITVSYDVPAFSSATSAK